MTDTSLHSRRAAPAVGSLATVGDYVALLKPRVVSLVVFTGAVGLYLAPGTVHPFLGVVALLCIAVAGGASGAINMWYDHDIDCLMRRTAKRPIPAGRVCPDTALAFGVALAAGAVATMGLALNWFAAGLLALSVGFYVFVYTMWLKRRTPQNIVIGGAAGAFPPLIGWAAVTGDVSLASLSLFAIVFMWTPPHFWALSLYSAEDYARAGVPMLPVVAGERETRRQILIYALLLLPVTLVPAFIGVTGTAYAAGATGLSALFVLGAWRVFRAGAGQHGAARRLFGFSILYLFALFALMVAERAIGAGA